MPKTIYNAFKIIFLLLLISGRPGISQVFEEGPDDFFIRHIDISNGLSNNNVTKIVEDQFGRMWFATEGGINRYDSKKIKILRPGDRYKGLRNENIETLFVDRDQNIWVGTKSGGLSKYFLSGDRFLDLNHKIDPENSASAIRITDIEQDLEGNIWVATQGLGMYVLSPDTHELLASFLPGKVIWDMEVDEYGNIWVAASGLLYQFDPSGKRLIQLDILEGASQLYYDHQNSVLLIGSVEGLFQFDTRNYALVQLGEDSHLQASKISVIRVDKKGRIWLGSWKQGLLVSSVDRTSFQKVPLSLHSSINSNYEAVLDIFMDKEGVIWVATVYGGVVKLDSKKSVSYLGHSYENQTNLPDNNIQGVVKDQQGALWCGTWSNGIGYAIDNKRFQQLPGTIGKKVQSFLETDGLMLAGTDKGLFAYSVKHPAKGVLWNILPSHKIKDIFEDSQGRLWVGSQQKGLHLFQNKKAAISGKGQHFTVGASETLKSDRISQVTEDVQGRIWVGTYNGLYVYQEQDSTFVRVDQGMTANFPSVIFLSLLSGKAGDLWVGMPGGLFRLSYTEKKVAIEESYRTAQGLQNDYVTAITNDSEGNIWLSHASGMAKILREEGIAVNLDEINDVIYSMNINACFNDGNHIYFGSSNGLFFIDPRELELSTSPPALVFDLLKIDNTEIEVGETMHGRTVLRQTMPFTKEINLISEESVITIGFVPTSFQNRLNLTYHYRVLGLQDTWINNGHQGEISFVGLKPGNYTLEVRSSIDGITFSKGTALAINVAPPLWLSPEAYVVYILLAALLVFLVYSFLVNRARLKSKLALAKLSREKDHELHESKLRFFTNITHELRTPLTLVVSPLSEILEDPKLNKGLKERLSYIDKNAHKLLRLINELLDFRKAEKNELQLKVAEGDFIDFAKEVFLSFKSYAEHEGVRYDFHSPVSSLRLTYDRDKMEIMLCNLLSNAFKFTSPKGKITLSIEDNEKECIIKVKDTGKGISKKNQDKIFNRYFQIQDSDSAKVVGSGIGLSLSQKIVQLHHGTIKVNSAIGQGTDFIVTIPKGGKHFKKEAFITDLRESENIEKYKQSTDPSSSKLFFGRKEKIRLLIVEDNKDILSYLKTMLEEDGYCIHLAENGLEGRDRAFELIPDLVISDIMMPEMDGIELCASLKNDLRTSHIPVILLTARTTTVHEVDGLETGADDYVRKPFDARVIKSRISSLLQNRQKVRGHLLNKIQFEPNQSIRPINRGEAFIKALSCIVEKSIDDESVTIETLSSEFCMSQSTLYRKVKSITGLSIVGFIRSIRLKKAAEMLLADDDAKLTTIAYAVGFKDYKYFKKSFIRQFGVSPRLYRENQLKEL
jgi:signal transduction histidine kinase/ligand-binding sensor domain-containing protein/DNA-binding response OmpR family regulator